MVKNKFFIKIDNSTRMTEGFKVFLFSVPFIIFIFLFSYVPLFGWAYAFFDYKPGLSLLDTAFVGFKNFSRVFSDFKELWRVLRNTLVMSGLGILGSPLPVIFAILLNELRSTKFKKLVQTTTTLPNFISWVIVFGIAFAFFSTEGFFNTIKLKLGMDVAPITILGNTDATWFFQFGLGMWKSLGWSAIVYIAAIAGIDSELFDAAKVDGANRFKTIWHITVPSIMPTYLVLMLLGISNILNSGFEQFFVFYNPLVAAKIEVLDYYVYKVGILSNDYPYSIALGMYKTAISVTLLFVANTIAKKIRGNSLF